MSSFRSYTSVLHRATALSAQESSARLVLRPAFPNRHVILSLRSGVKTRAQAPTPKPDVSSPKGPIRPMEPTNDPSKKSANTAFAATVLCTLAVGLGFYTLQLITVANQPVKDPSIRLLENQKDVAAIYDETADKFDSDVGISETLMGLMSVRKQLSKQCKGHVLEVSCGTGRNIGYYDLSPGSAIDSLTFNDLSKQMVEMCKKKWATHHPASEATTKLTKPGLSVRFSTGSALDPMPLAPGEKKYDTIIQTMGICSTPSPHDLIRNMAQHLNTDNPEARILLLEHGRGEYEWVNNILDNSGQKHAEIHGCWFNRDIGGIVNSVAAETGLEVVSEKRKHFGTTWIYELKPSGVRPKAPVATSAAAEAEEKASSGWRSWLGMK